MGGWWGGGGGKITPHPHPPRLGLTSFMYNFIYVLEKVNYMYQQSNKQPPLVIYFILNSKNNINFEQSIFFSYSYYQLGNPPHFVVRTINNSGFSLINGIT